MEILRPDATDVSEHRRDREAGRLVYPVVSRRSGGLSLGINLFPDRKTCNFDCPYCEVFPFPAAPPFSIRALGAELDEFLDSSWAASWAPRPIRDICISGNGEPSLSPLLEAAASLCAAIRARRPALLGDAKLVLITNATGFLSERGRQSLGRVQDLGFELWAKLDGGSQAVFERMSRSSYRLGDIVAGLRSYARDRPLVVQTMLCEVEGISPDEGDVAAYADTLLSLLREGARISGIQLYTLARPPAGGVCRALPDVRLARLAELLAQAFAAGGRGDLAIEVFSEQGALDGRAAGAPADKA